MKIAIKLVFLTAVLLGLVYPLVITGLAQVMFPSQATGAWFGQATKWSGRA